MFAGSIDVRPLSGNIAQRRLSYTAGALVLVAFVIAFAIGSATRAHSATPPHAVVAASMSPTSLHVVGIESMPALPALKIKSKPTTPAKPKTVTKKQTTTNSKVINPASRVTQAAKPAKRKAAKRKTAHKKTSSHKPAASAPPAGTGTVSGGG